MFLSSFIMQYEIIEEFHYSFAAPEQHLRNFLKAQVIPNISRVY
jgi:hypothetical protein